MPNQKTTIKHKSLISSIECGCCSYVCPSKIPLVQYYRHAKGEIWAAEREKAAADIARQRHEFRQERMEREAAEKAERQRQKKAALAAKKKAAEKKDAEEPSKKSAIDEAVEKAKAKRLKQGPKAEKQQQSENKESETSDS